MLAVVLGLALQVGGVDHDRWRPVTVLPSGVQVDLDARSVQTHGSKRVVWVRYYFQFALRSPNGHHMDNWLGQIELDCSRRTSEVLESVNRMGTETVEMRPRTYGAHAISPESAYEKVLEMVCR